jgi:hypothetical protein
MKMKRSIRLGCSEAVDADVGGKPLMPRVRSLLEAV